MNQTPVTRREVSEWLGIKQATLRTWDRKFRDWLEASVGQKGNATRKQYTENDLKVFQAISQLRQRGATFDEIYDKLDGELLNTRLPEFGAAFVQSASQPVMAAQGVPSVSNDELLKMHQEIAELRGQLSAVTRERDRLMRMLEDEQKDRIAAEKTAAVLEGQLRIYRDGTYPNTPQPQQQQQIQPQQPAVHTPPPPPPVYRADAPPPLPPVREPEANSGTPASNPDLNRVRRIPNSDEKKEESEKDFPSWWKKTDRR